MHFNKIKLWGGKKKFFSSLKSYSDIERQSHIAIWKSCQTNELI